MKFLSLTNSKKKAIIDDWHYERIMALNTNWFVHYNKYGKPDKICSTKKFKNRIISLHRFILKLRRYDFIIPDHHNKCIFDNRDKNLRICTSSQNKCNQVIPKNSTTGEKNINFHPRSKDFRVRVTKDGVTYDFGGFKTLEEAIPIRNKAVKKLHGEYASF